MKAEWRRTTYTTLDLVMRPASILLITLLACGSAQAQRTATPEDLARRIDAVLDAAAFEEAFWGVLAVDLETGRTVYARNADKRFLPASNLKLITTAAALDGLGPDSTSMARFGVLRWSATSSSGVRGILRSEVHALAATIRCGFSGDGLMR